MMADSIHKMIWLFSIAFIMTVSMVITQYESVLNKKGIMALWGVQLIAIPFMCSFAALLIALTYPVNGQKQPSFNRKIMTACKSLMFFIGMNSLCAEVTFSSFAQFCTVLITLSVLYWMWLDRRTVSFWYSAMIATNASVFAGVAHSSRALREGISVAYIMICVGCFCFTGSLTMGNIVNTILESSAS